MPRKIDDFEAVCEDSASCPCPADEPNPLWVGEKVGSQNASKARFCWASGFCNWLFGLLAPALAQAIEPVKAGSCATSSLDYGNPPEFSEERHAQRTFLYAEFFFGSPSVDGLAYVIRPSADDALTGKFTEPSEQWDPGFCVGFGSHFAHDSWEFSGDWSFLASKAVQTVHGDSLTPLYIDASSYDQIEAVQQAKEAWDFSLNALTGRLGRLYFLSQELDIHPEIGILASWIDQSVQISYRNNTATSGLIAYQTNISNNSFRAGPFLGTHLNWHIRRKFRIFGGGSAALCYRTLQFEQTQISVGNTDGDFRIYLTDDSKRLQPYLNCQIGVAWGSFIKKDRNFCEIALQYENQYFWREFESRLLYEQVDSSYDRSLNTFGDLSLQSVALRLRLDF